MLVIFYPVEWQLWTNLPCTKNFTLISLAFLSGNKCCMIMHKKTNRCLNNNMTRVLFFCLSLTCALLEIHDHGYLKPCMIRAAIASSLTQLLF